MQHVFDQPAPDELGTDARLCSEPDLGRADTVYHVDVEERGELERVCVACGEAFP